MPQADFLPQFNNNEVPIIYKETINQDEHENVIEEIFVNFKNKSKTQAFNLDGWDFIDNRFCHANSTISDHSNILDNFE